MATVLPVPGSAHAAAGDVRQPVVYSIDGTRLLRLNPGDEVALEFGATSPVARLAGGPVHYRRVLVGGEGAEVGIAVHVLAEEHRQEPRFTVFSPQLVLLDDKGAVRRVVALDQLVLDIRPFQPTRLRQCVRTRGVHSFLIASDPSRLGELYQFNARVAGSGFPDHGFYRAHSPMQVYLTYTDVGRVELQLIASPDDRDCMAVPG